MTAKARSAARPSEPVGELERARARIAELEALETEHRRAEQVQSALYRIAESASGAEDLPSFYETVHAIVGELMHAANFYIALVDGDHGRINYPYFVDAVDTDVPDPRTWYPFGEGQATGVTAYALRLGRPLRLDAEGHRELVRRGEVQTLGIVAEGEWMGVPLLAEGRTLGLLVVQTYEADQRYGEGDLELLAYVGQHVGSALSRARAIEETRERNAELAVVNEIGRALAEQLDFGAISEIVGERIRAMFDVRSVSIGLLDPAATEVRFVYEVDEGQRIQTPPLPLGAGLVSTVVRTRAPLRLGDEGELDAHGGLYLGGSMPASWLGVPIMTGERVIGVINLESIREHAFDEADARLLGTLASSMGVALENARLFDETKRLLAVADERAAELAIVNSVQQGLASQVDMQAMYDLVGDKIQEIFDAQGVDIEVYDRASGLVQAPYSIERGVRLPDEPIQLMGFRRLVVETSAPVVVNRDLERRAAEAGQPAVIQGELARSAVFVPLVGSGEVSGFIMLENLDHEDAFSEADVRLLTTLAGSLSVALENARLFAETKRLLAETDERAAELAIINGVQQGLAEQIDMQAMYDLVGDKIQEIFDAQVVDIAIHDVDEGVFLFPYTIERGERFREAPLPFDDPGAPAGTRRHVMETAAALLVDEGLRGRMAEYGIPGIMSGEPPLSALFVPLIVGGHATGIISLQNLDREHAFSDADVRLLTTLAASLSVALENARLIHETRQRVAELAIVNRVGQALASQLELGALVELVGEEMAATFGADIVYVALHDPATELITFPYFMELGERRDQPPIHFGEGLTSRILSTRAPLLLNREEHFAAIGTRGVGTLAKSYLGVPILVGDSAIGVISVQSSIEEGRFGDEDARLLGTLAANVGVAIQNARLYEDSRRQAEEMAALAGAQREAELRYRNLVEQLPLAVYIDDPVAGGAAQYVSPRIEALFGYPAAAWLDDGFFSSVLHPDDREQVLRDHDEAFARGDERFAFEYRVVAADGRSVWIRDEAVIIKDDAGVPRYVQGFMMDVTDRTLTHAEVRRQKQYFESLVEISPVAVVTMDPDELVTGWNPAASGLFGYRPEAAIGRPIDDLILVEQTLRDEGREVAREALAEGRAHRLTRRRHRDGTLLDVEMVMVPLVVDGAHAGFYAIYHDVTELQAARREADAANQAKSSFLASMSHEIRTPMNAIIGMSGLLLGTPLTDEQRDFAETIRTSGDALLTIINDILDFSKIEAGKVDLDHKPFVLSACVEGALDVLASTAAGKGLELAYAVEEGLPRTVVGDAGRLRQVVLNLLSNAVKFTERGEVELTLGGRPLGAGGTAEAEAGDPWEFTIAVRDTGIGIPPDRMDRLFQSFSQADASISRRYGGTGLGLAISRRLAELMGGSLVATSAGVAGEGSTFTLTFRADEAADRVAAPAPLLSVDLAGRRVLVVDDNATNRRILVTLLGRWGMVAEATGSPREALGWVAAGRRFDAALVDFHMPELDGVALGTAIRASEAGAATPVIVLSSLGVHGRTDEAIAAFLVKPVKPSALHDALATALAGGAAAVPVRTTTAPALEADLAARHPLRILLAEDNPVNRKLALRLLERLGYRADVAGNGQEAVAALEGTPYDVVLMDVQMPELDGLEATRRIRRRWPGDAGPRIVAMTANAMEGDREECLAAGMDDYISKPIRPEALVAALVETRGRGDASSAGSPA